LLLLAAVLLSACGGGADSELRERAAALEAANQALEARLEAAITAATAAGNALAQSREDAEAQRRRVGGLQARLRALNAERDHLAAGVAGSSSRSLHAQGAAAASARGLAGLRQRNDMLSRQLAALNGMLAQRSAENQTQGNLLRRLQEEARDDEMLTKSLRDELQERDVELVQLRTALATGDTASAQLEEIIESLSAQLDSARAAASAEQSRLRSELEHSRERARALQEANAGLTQRNAALKRSVEDEATQRFRNAKDYLVDQVEQLDQSRASLLGQVKEARQAGDEAVSRTASSGESRVSELQSELTAMQTLLEEREQTIDEATEMLTLVKGKRSELFTRARELDRQMAVLDEKILRAHSARDYLEDKLAEVTDALRQQRETSAMEEKRLQAALQLALQESAAQARRATEAETTLSALRDRGERDELARQITRANALADRARLLENTLDTISADALRNADAAQELEKLRPRLKQAETRANALEGRSALLEQTLDHVFKTRDDARAALEAELDGERANQAALEREIVALRERSGMLERTAAYSAGELTRVRAASEALSSCRTTLAQRDGRLRDISWANEVLTRDNAALEARVDALEISLQDCKKNSSGS
jgi:chromosome segregation ATPase